jgi:predicted amidohydrolase
MRTVFLALTLTLAFAAGATCRAETIRIAVVQMAEGPDIAPNRDRILAWIPRAAAERARVVVFPEAALRAREETREGEVEQAIGAIREAARTHRVYVVFGGWTQTSGSGSGSGKNANWMRVVDPSGSETFRYDKLYDNHRATMPGVFQLDGVPAGAIICADRWLRGVEELPIQQGARISIELSNNFASEWVPAFGWYWYVPRALRNNVWVIFANSASGAGKSGHGHSAIIAPDGEVVASVPDDRETLIVADIDPARATRAEALARRRHPLLGRLWERGASPPGDTPARFRPLDSPEVTLTIAAAQVTGLEAVEASIREAKAHGADLVAFPEGAVTGGLDRIRAAARAQSICVVVGLADDRHNSAFVVGPDGNVLTRYDQLAATAPREPGTDPASMWFRVRGVPAVVTIGRDGLWTEIAELAAVAGAQVHIHLADEPPGRRLLQTWSNLASYVTFTATVNAQGGSALWDDLRTMEERRAEVKGGGNRDTGGVEVFSPFSANLVVRAGNGPEILYASRKVNKRNPYHPRRTTAMNPEMSWWYEQGAMQLMPGTASPP